MVFKQDLAVCVPVPILWGKGIYQWSWPNRLLGIHASKAKQLDQLLLNKEEIFRPGYTRVSLSYVMTDEEVKFIQDALIFISQYGWLLLPNYIFYEDTGEWRHKTIKNKKPFRRWLNDIWFVS